MADRHFLYPLSERDGNFLLRNDSGETAGTSFDEFHEIKSDGSRSEWRLSSNFKQIQLGDLIWAYFTAPRKAIGAVGVVVGEPGWNDEWDRHGISIEWNQPLTQRLKRNPIEYTKFNQRVQYAATTANPKTATVLDRWLRTNESATGRATRERVQFARRSVKVRLGQPEFRQRLMDAYRGECPITGCAVSAALQAAHIDPVAASGTHGVKNGLLLRSDIHNLFDVGLIAIDEKGRVLVADELDGTEYESLRRRKLRQPRLARDQPSTVALRQHRKQFGWE